MIKVVGFLKRKPGMSVAAFRDYYESTHRLIGERVLAGYACHYARRFLDGYSDAADAPFGVEGDYDVIMEIWYPSEAAYAAAQRHLSSPDIRAEIVADEEKLFDRPRNRFFTLVESVSELPPVA
ncbi:MAG: EthD domain-containing protein [Pseudomonadota bacterium]